MFRPTATPFTMRPWALAAYLGLFILVVLVTLPYVTDPPVQVIPDAALPTGFNAHVSNLMLSFVLLFCYGFLRLLYGATVRELAIVGGIIIAANWVYEVFLTLWNTRDVVDAVYGTVGTLLAGAFLAAVRRWGLVATPSVPGEPAEGVDRDLAVGGGPEARHGRP